MPEVAVAAEGLTRRFGDFTPVDHVGFRIERGEIFGYANGSTEPWTTCWSCRSGWPRS